MEPRELTKQDELKINKMVVRALNNLTDDIEGLSHVIIDEVSYNIQTDDDAIIYCFEKLEYAVYEFIRATIEYELSKPNAVDLYPEIF